MTLVQRGRGGWVNSSGALAGCAMVALFCIALAATAGCSSKKSGQAGAGEGAGQLGESGTGAAGGSLQQFQQGTLGAGGQGPLSDIHFAYNEYTIQPQDGSILHSNATWLSQHANSRVQIEGHCDERGSEEYNIALGAKRAQAAKDYLVTLGISGDRISTISYGKELPLCTEHDESCWSQNRRDHFVVTQ
jgi:peptidoglycan-associated lipoprotein